MYAINVKLYVIDSYNHVLEFFKAYDDRPNSNMK